MTAPRFTPTGPTTELTKLLRAYEFLRRLVSLSLIYKLVADTAISSGNMGHTTRQTQIIGRPGFEPGPVHVGSMRDKVASGQIFTRVLGLCPVTIIPPVLYTHISFAYNRRYIVSATDSVVKQNTSLLLSIYFRNLCHLQQQTQLNHNNCSRKF
jgi:hypothetical protein